MTSIDKNQAAAIADALLAPRAAELEAARDTREQKRVAAMARQKQKRVAAWLALIGGAIGIGIAHGNGYDLWLGFLYGAIAGANIGWFVSLLWRTATK